MTSEEVDRLRFVLEEFRTCESSLYHHRGAAGATWGGGVDCLTGAGLADWGAPLESTDLGDSSNFRYRGSF